MPTEQPVPTTEKSPEVSPLSTSDDPTAKLSTLELLGEVGADSVTVGAPRSIINVAAEKLAVGPDRLCASTTELAVSVGIKVPSPHPETESVKLVPEAALTEKLQFGAFPELEKSELLNPLMLEAKLRE